MSISPRWTQRRFSLSGKPDELRVVRRIKWRFSYKGFQPLKIVILLHCGGSEFRLLRIVCNRPLAQPIAFPVTFLAFIIPVVTALYAASAVLPVNLCFCGLPNNTVTAGRWNLRGRTRLFSRLPSGGVGGAGTTVISSGGDCRSGSEGLGRGGSECINIHHTGQYTFWYSSGWRRAFSALRASGGGAGIRPALELGAVPASPRFLS